ncbi:hypothetical protein M7I_5501 [Glarea lozoyensis 74030]|uniref:Uncharacterized protein n=1 Tax=Glarea lozoyensis (strain ATCC 74030 / MF5533) TaxID=1104152 RepID=H0ES26_GLAL7|nr:hypothetical protein M7I_5501 [Glarea lozoyensis 74030]
MYRPEIRAEAWFIMKQLTQKATSKEFKQFLKEAKAYFLNLIGEVLHLTATYSVHREMLPDNRYKSQFDIRWKRKATILSCHISRYM